LEELLRKRLSQSVLSDYFCRFGRWFAHRVCRHLQGLEVDPSRDLFFGFNTNCLEALEWLRTQGVFTVVDQVDPGRVEENVVLEEAARWPGWATTASRFSQEYWDRLSAEWAAADIVLVNSEWSADALVRQGVPRSKLLIVPLAIEATRAPLQPANPGGALKVIWIGSVILRKGIQYLVEAARLLETARIEFLLAGPIGISPEALRSFPSNIKPLGRVTRDQLSTVFRQGHVFVLPTLSDGFAITQLEAMAHGLPVIATPNCGQVVTDGVDGFIIPPRDSQCLAETLLRLNSDRDLLRFLSSNALLTVRKYDAPSSARLLHREVIRNIQNRNLCRFFSKAQTES
jgi:glycosyltransferase involved in cell wall biosynthesis